MIIHIFPDTDSTLYEVSASMNTGIDQVLELEKVVTQAETPKSSILVLYKNMIYLQFQHH